MNKNILLVIFGISGMTALIYELIWIRPLSLVFGTTTYAVSTIIASFILGLAIGSWVIGRYSDRLKNPLKTFGFIQIGVGIYGILLLPLFGTLPEIYLGLYHATFPNQTLFTFTQILMSMSMITIPAILMGATLPLMMKAYSSNNDTIGKDVGRLDASNSFGAVIGTLGAGFLMIPILGIQYSITLTAIISIVLGLTVLITRKSIKIKHLAIVIAIVIPLFVLYPAYDIEPLQLGIYAFVDPDLTMDMYNELNAGQEILFYKESMYQSVMVTSYEEDDGLRLRLNGKVQCSTNEHTYVGLVRLSYLPYHLFDINNGAPPQNALNIGLGCGITANELSPHVDLITVEIDPVVVEASSYFYDSVGNVVIDDARNWMLRNNQQFDIIVTEPSDPYHNNGILYTQEHFVLLSSRLSDDGVVAQWVPTFELENDTLMIFYNTFNSVFPFVYIYQMEENSMDQLIFIGSKKPLTIDYDERTYLADHTDIQQVETELNTDDRPILEFETAKSLYTPKHDRKFLLPILQ